MRNLSIGNDDDRDEFVEGTPPRSSEPQNFKLKVAQLRVLRRPYDEDEEYNDYNEHRFDIFENINIIGSDPTADVFLDSEGVSARHACIEVFDGEHFIEDLHSKNGVALNRGKIKPGRMYQLIDRKNITIGNATAVYEILPEPVRVYFPDTNSDGTGTQPTIPSTIPVVPTTLSLSLVPRRVAIDPQADDDIVSPDDICASPTMPMGRIDFVGSEDDEPEDESVAEKKETSTRAKQDTNSTVVADSQPLAEEEEEEENDVETDRGGESPQVIRDSTGNSPLHSPTHPQKVDASAEIFVRSLDSVVMSDDDDISILDSNEETATVDPREATKEDSPDILGDDDTGTEISRAQSRASEREFDPPADPVVEDQSGIQSDDVSAPDAPIQEDITPAVPENESTSDDAGENTTKDFAAESNFVTPTNLAKLPSKRKEPPKRRRLGTRGKLLEVAKKDDEEQPHAVEKNVEHNEVLQNPQSGIVETSKSGRRQRNQKPSASESTSEVLDEVNQEDQAKEPRQATNAKAKRSLKRSASNNDCLTTQPPSSEHASKQEPDSVQTDKPLEVEQERVIPKENSPAAQRPTKRKRRATTSSENLLSEGVTAMSPPALSPPPPAIKQYGRKTPSRKKMETADTNVSTQKRQKRSNTPSVAATEIDSLSQKSADGIRHATRSHSTDLETIIPKVCFTGIPTDKIPKIVKGLGAIPVDSWQECTHLVTDKVRRTVKFLCALSTGKHIVSVNWLEACRKEKKFVGVEPYTLQDPESEKLYGFSLLETQNKVRQDLDHKIFQGMKIYGTPSTPPKQEIQQLVEAAGAEYLKRVPSQPSDDIVIMGCQEDAAECQKYMDQGFNVVTNEYILCGILQHRADVEPYRLKLEDAKRPAGGGRRKR